jgi:cob(I)alamin adenosyltransferase
MSEKEGLIYVFEGDGKGKTSAALGVALRMLLLQKRVEWISWFKEESWKTAEMKLTEVFPENLNMHWMGKGFYGGPADHNTKEGHKKAANDALALAEEILLKNEELGDGLGLLVLDEVLRAIDSGFLESEDLREVINKRGGTHLILTGQECPADLVEVVDLVTEMKKVKHPFDKGVLAVPGLDF